MRFISAKFSDIYQLIWVAAMPNRAWKLLDDEEFGLRLRRTYVKPSRAGACSTSMTPARQLRCDKTQGLRDNLLLKPDAGNLGAFLRRLRERYPDHYRQIVEVVRLAAPFFGDFVYRRDTGDSMELEWFEADDPDTVLGPRQFSDGTLRFICLATLLLQPVELPAGG